MRRGLCPGVHEPMPSGDGLLIRVKPFGGRLDATKLRVIADVASECGNGMVELTSRGNLQLRGLSDESVAIASNTLVAAGLADAEAARERRRNVIAVPPCDDALVARIEAVMAEIADLAPKFCVAVGDADADIVARDGFVIAGDECIACEGQDVAAVVERIARAAGGRRMTSRSAHSMIETACHPSPQPPPVRRGGVAPAFPPPLVGRAGGGAAALIALPFGQTASGALLALAKLVNGATLQTTPWRAFYINAKPDQSALAALGFIIDATDPRRSIAACPGAPACNSATVATRADANFLASLGIGNIHVSGCAKGCAHHRSATTLTGSNGRYNLVRHGLASDAPELIGLTIDEAAAALA